MSKPLQKNRIEWVDVLRGIAIICVMLSHYDIPFAYFAHKFCVALFFFVSGMMSGSSKKLSVVQYTKNQAAKILLPYAIFSFVNAGFYYIFNRGIGIKGIVDIIITFAAGRRNTLACAPMWFLPCLFVVCIIYRLLAQFAKKDLVLVPLCLAVSAVAKMFFEEPIMVWSFNHALKYLVYYAIGAAVFPYLKKVDIKQIAKGALWQKAVFLFVVVFGLWYGYRLYSGKLIIVPANLVTACIMVFVNAMIMVVLCIAISMLLYMIKPLALLGRDTMGFCLGESISRALLNTAMALTGIGFAANTQPKVIVYNFLAMAISYVVIITPLNLFCPQLLGKAKKVKKEKVNQ